MRSRANRHYWNPNKSLTMARYLPISVDMAVSGHLANHTVKCYIRRDRGRNVCAVRIDVARCRRSPEAPSNNVITASASKAPYGYKPTGKPDRQVKQQSGCH